MSGVIFDVIGRKKTIIGLLILGALSTYMFPVASPSDIQFILFRVLFQCSMTCLLANPLINDYVITENRGKATAV